MMKKVISLLLTKPNEGRKILILANQARDAKDYGTAARLYAEYLEANPDNAAIHVQCAHMYKEAGRLDDAGKHYDVAEHLMPDDADLQIQLGHYLKVSGKLEEGIKAYRRATVLSPNNQDAKQQLEAAIELSRAPQNAHIAIGAKLLIRAKLSTKAEDFLRNAPTAVFNQTIEAIADSKQYYLLEALEQRFPDSSLSEQNIVACLELCMEAQAIDTVRCIVDTLLESNPMFVVPIRMLRQCLTLAEQERVVISAPANVPHQAQLAMISIATNIISRQRAIIEELSPTP